MYESSFWQKKSRDPIGPRDWNRLRLYLIHDHTLIRHLSIGIRELGDINTIRNFACIELNCMALSGFYRAIEECRHQSANHIKYFQAYISSLKAAE